jgi:hypothetical protein
MVTNIFREAYDMKQKNALVVIVASAFIINLTACAAVRVRDNAGTADAKPKTAKQLKYEQDEETRSLIVKGICSFAGLVIGGLTGLLTAPKSNAVTSSILGCAIGGAVGFGFGMVIFDSTKPGEQKPDEEKVKEYFQDYRNIQLKE